MSSILHRRWMAGVITFVAIGGAALVLWPAMRHAPAPVAAGQSAPHFVALTLDAVPARRSLDDYAGQPLLLNVWATWCDPCREEMPGLQRLYQDYRPRGLRIVAVSIDDPGNEPLIREFVREHGLTFDILRSPGSEIMTQYLVRGVPETFLISPKGEIVGTRFAADWSTAESRALVDSLVRGGRP